MGKRNRRGLAQVALGFAILGVLGSSTARTGEAAASLTGTMYAQDGRPAAGVQVTLSRSTSVGDAIFGLLATVFSFGLACITSSVQLCQNNSASLTTRSDGRYSFNFRTTTSFGNPADFSLTATAPPAPGELRSPSVSAAFKLTSDNGALPDLHLYRPTLAYAGDRLRGHLNFDPLPAAGGAPSEYQFTFADAGGTVIRQVSPASPGQELDARLLEDVTGTISVTTSAVVGGARLNYQSQAVAFAGSAGAPMSRSRSCGLLTGAAAPTAESPCGLTNGDLARPAFLASEVPQGTCAGAPATPRPGLPSPSPSPCVRALPYLDLGGNRYLGLVLVHGWSTAALEGSTDGRAWRRLGVTSQGQRLLPAGTRARYLRADSSEPVSALRELSAWEGEPPPPSAGVFGSNGGAAASVARVGLPAGLLLLLVLLGIGAAYVLGRRRNRRSETDASA